MEDARLHRAGHLFVEVTNQHLHFRDILRIGVHHHRVGIVIGARAHLRSGRHHGHARLLAISPGAARARHRREAAPVGEEVVDDAGHLLGIGVLQFEDTDLVGALFRALGAAKTAR